MATKPVEYQDDSLTLEGYLAVHDDGAARPGVLISHAWGGLGEFEQGKAHKIADLGYNAFCLDMYGKGVRGGSVEENRKLMAPFLDDRALLRQRIQAALKTMRDIPEIDGDKIVAIGYCFGGLCVLDLARSGAEVQGVVSIHGMFNPPENLTNEIIKAKVLALHGYDDPMATPEQLTAFATEMTDAGVDWQVHAYGLTYHAFTNPKANNPEMGTVYNPAADQRSWIALQNFLAEAFE